MYSTRRKHDQPNADLSIRHVLKGAPQDLWLDTIRRAKYASHNTLISWMLSQPECDFAIAVHAFYRSNPAKHLDDPKPLPAHPEPDDIFSRVLIQWDIGFYRTHRLAVEERDAPLRQIARLNQKIIARPRGSLPFQVPARFLEPKGGTTLSLPAHLSPTAVHNIWKKYADAGLDVPASAPGLPRQIAQIKNRFLRRTERH
ncbi:hypothetical protein [Yoonia maritima]|uniref:hypothetical protein n=1 Tax=Yoonia maritima TaxID=1435347 RepID=UPI000D10D1EF|nr:hypothetical protein [Yoonia maritima]